MSEQEAYEAYNDYLDEIGIESLNLPPAHIALKECDPVQYDYGFANFCDAESIELED